MASKTYYVKVHGRVLGPIAFNRLKQMVESGKLNHSHQVSTDGHHWRRAGELEEIFEEKPDPAAAPNPEGQPYSLAPAQPVAQPQMYAQPGVEMQPGFGQQPMVSTHPAVAGHPMPANPMVQPGVQPGQPAAGGAGEGGANQAKPPGQIDWYYSTDDEPVGPVSRADIIDRIKAGDIVRSDMVWQSEMNDWARAGKRPEFKAAFEQMMANVPSVTAKPSNTLDLARTMERSKQILIVLSVVLFLATVSLLILFLSCFDDGSGQGTANMQRAIVVLVLAGTAVGSMVMVTKYIAEGNKFLQSKDVSTLNDAMVWLQRFWLLITITIALAVLLLMLVIFNAI